MAKVTGPISVSLGIDTSLMEEGLNDVVVITDDLLRDNRRQVLGEELLREIPIAEFMVDDDMLPLLDQRLEAARQRGAGIREQCKIIGVPWAYRIVPWGACTPEMASAAEALPRSVFCQTFPKDAEAKAQREWAMLVSRSGHNAQWMAYNALALVDAAGGFQPALDVTDYVADAHEFPKTKKVHVVIKESRDWHAGRLRVRAWAGGGGGAGAVRTVHMSEFAIDLAAGPDQHVEHVIIGGGGAGGAAGGGGGRNRALFPELFRQQVLQQMDMPMLVMGANAARNLPVDRVVRFADSDRLTVGGVQVTVNHNLRPDDIFMVDRQGMMSQITEDMRHAIADMLQARLGLMAETKPRDPTPIVYPFAELLPIRIDGAELVLLTTWEEFQRESALMDHCVGRSTHGPRYWQRAKKMEIMVGSARADGVETPLATIEFSPDHHPVQIRGQHNHQPPDQHLLIVNRLIREFQSRVPRLRAPKSDARVQAGLRCYGGPVDGQMLAAGDNPDVLEVPARERTEYIGDWNREYIRERRRVRVERYRRGRFLGGRIEAWIHESVTLEEAEWRVERDHLRYGMTWFGR